MPTSPLPGVEELARALAGLGWVTDLFVAGSAATGDYVPGVSDLDLVALTDGSVDDKRQHALTAIHRALDDGAARGADLGCVYVDERRLDDLGAQHPTWTHGRLVQRILSGVTRAELVRHGYALCGREPAIVLAPVTDDDVRRAARDELTGYWRSAVRHPWWWLDPALADLGLTSMARGRHALATGDLLPKTAAIEAAHAPPWLREQLRRRRRGDAVTSPRVRTAAVAWFDALRTTSAARRQGDRP